MRGIDVRLIENSEKGKSEKENGNINKVSDILNKDITLFGSGIKDKRKESFYLEMSILLSAGMDIRTVLDLILSEINKKSERSVFQNIKDDILKGSVLSEAINNTNHFSKYEYFSIKIGEETGKLPEVLKDLAGYYKRKITQRRKLTTALTYPAIIISFAFLAVFFMLNFVVPMFADVFKRFGGELPAITKFILNLSTFFKKWFWFLVVGIIVFLAFIYNQRNKIWWRNLSSRLVLKIPVIGGLVQKIYLSRFCNSMHLMIQSKVNILRAISLIRQMIGFYPIESTLEKVERDVLDGKSLHQSLSAFPIYPTKMTSLIKAGEEVNKLDFFFKTLYDQYTEETEHQTTLLGNLLEPIIIIFLGIIVGTILIAMYLPLFQLGQNI